MLRPQRRSVASYRPTETLAQEFRVPIGLCDIRTPKCGIRVSSVALALKPRVLAVLETARWLHNTALSVAVQISYYFGANEYEDYH